MAVFLNICDRNLKQSWKYVLEKYLYIICARYIRNVSGRLR